MPTIASAPNTPFTPVVGSFIAQSTGGPANLERRNTAGAPFCILLRIDSDRAVVVSNPVAGADYQFTAVDPGEPPTVQADQ